MIALRGSVRHVSQKKAATSPNGDSATELDFNPKDTKEGDWIWTGHWAFGSLPDEEILAVSNKKLAVSNRKKKPHAFVYKFHKISNAHDITVPSSLVTSDDGGDDDEKSPEINMSKADGYVTEKEEHDPDLDCGEKGDPISSGGISKEVGIIREGNEKLPTFHGSSSSEPPVVTAVKSSMKIKTGERDTVIHGEDSGTLKFEPETKSVKNETKSEVVTREHMEKGELQSGKAIRGTSEEEVERQEELVSSNLALADGESSGASMEMLEKRINENNATNSEVDVEKGELRSSKACAETVEDKEHQEKLVGSTFAVADGAEFTDAGLDLSNKCPVAGCWKGYFENVSRRKDRMTSRVQESFHLFFNSTPPDDAKMAFDLDDNEENDNDNDVTKSVDSGSLPSNYMHVRGAGTNQFGTFEIIGGYNLTTGVLSCQRIYVSTTDGADAKSGKNTKDKAKETAPMRKSYFTRKRPVSFKRRGYGSDQRMLDAEGGVKKSSGGGRKRLRVSEVPSSKHDDGIVKNKVSVMPIAVAAPSPSVPVTSTQDTAMHLEKNTSIVKGQLSGRRSSPGKTAQAGRKSKATPISNGKTSQPSNSLNAIAIPKVGNPLEARWRSAHFLYYHRHTDGTETPDSSLSNPAPTPVTPTKTSYVVYEGEMNVGNNIRDGKGTCLYNNNMIYEGEWRRNKEHGRGSLFTGDRSHTIYAGEWERGKMHGKGTYYYHMFTNGANLENVGKYDGEFKENSRHGIGTYTFADGSIYEGDWRDNVPCGKGVFRWQDQSVYDGYWKDGKRNGLGNLEALDGFKYDGMWVDNAMEGKGCATYPNGQQYNGMWLNGKRDGRGTIIFGNGAVYKGRFKDDCMEGQGTLKIEHNISVPRVEKIDTEDEAKDRTMKEAKNGTAIKDDWMIPIEFQSDIGHIHQKAGFTTGGE